MGKGRKSKNELVDLLLSSCNDVVRTGENVLYCCKCDHRIDLNDREGLRNKILRHYSSDNHFLKCSWSTRVDVHGEVHIKRPQKNTLLDLFNKKPRETEKPEQKIDEPEQMNLSRSIDDTKGSPDEDEPAYHDKSEERNQSTSKSKEQEEREERHDKADKIAAVFGLKADDFTDAAIDALKDHRFLTGSVKNVAIRSKGKTLPHVKVVSATLKKAVLTFGSAPASAFSQLVGGPSDRTLNKASTENQVPLYDHFREANIQEHAINAQEILEQRCSNSKNVLWALSVDATPLNQDVFIYPDVQKNHPTKPDLLVGADHHIFDPVYIYREPQESNPEALFIDSEGKVINGTDAVAQLRLNGVLKAASQCSVLALTPLVPNAFTYILMLFPTDSKVKGTDLYQLYVKVANIVKVIGIRVIAIIGDGDSRLRALQRLHYLRFPMELDFLRKLEFPFLFGFGADLVIDLPMSDLLHTIKKLRNNAKYLTTRILLFCDPDEFTPENRLKYAATWETVAQLFESSQRFRDVVNRSSVAVNDKMDPSAVTNLMYQYDIFYEHGYDGMGVYLETMLYLFSAI